MADKDVPRRFAIRNGGNIASTQTVHGCSSITFKTSTPHKTWSAISVPGDFFGFQQSETGYWATAVDGQILACPDFSQKQQSSFRIIDNHDGTSLIQLNTSKAIWTKKPDGSLGLGPAIAGPNNVFHFVAA